MRVRVCGSAGGGKIRASKMPVVRIQQGLSRRSWGAIDGEIGVIYCSGDVFVRGKNADLGSIPAEGGNDGSSGRIG